MSDFVNTLLIACIPAIITGVVSFLVANKNAVVQINVVKEQNKHDLEKLVEQHKIDIDSIEKQHQQEIDKMELEHKHKLELITAENENSLSQELISTLVGEIIKMPEAKAEIAKGMKQSSHHKGGRR